MTTTTATAAISLGLVDDHTLFRKGMISLIKMVQPTASILFEADNGQQLQDKINFDNQPDILLLDVNMPGMDGFATVRWMREEFPLVRILVVSMISKEESIIRMLKLGVKGYICKDVEPAELSAALVAVMNKGYYYTDFITGKLLHTLLHDSEDKRASKDPFHQLNDREREFLRYACTEMTYNEIAAKMFLSPKTIDGYRNSLFEKLGVKSRVGLVMFAIKHGFVEL